MKSFALSSGLLDSAGARFVTAPRDFLQTALARLQDERLQSRPEATPLFELNQYRQK
jgi:hypothetical protein